MASEPPSEPKPESLTPPKGTSGKGEAQMVDGHHARFHRAAMAFAVWPSAYRRRSEAVGQAVRFFHRLVEVGEGEDHGERPNGSSFIIRISRVTPVTTVGSKK